jgi:glycosyltransferase involved in cell wall biosynthesis
MNKVEHSILAPAIIEPRIIPNGIDLAVFHPADRQKVREELNISQDVFVLLFAANKARQSFWKDYMTLHSAVQLLAHRFFDQRILFIALGEDGEKERFGNATLTFLPYHQDPVMVARYYQAADVYIHAAKADNFPTTILEALACGTPVVTTAVGGIPEQIDDGKTGFLVPPKSPEAVAMTLQKFLQDSALQRQMRIQAAETAQRRFDANRMVEDYLEWYQRILS